MTEPAADPQIHPDLVAALSRYSEALPDRPVVDPPGLAFALLNSAIVEPSRGLLASRLQNAGVDLDAASTALLGLVERADATAALPLSSSVERAVSNLAREGPVSSWQVARQVFDLHPEYGQGLGKGALKTSGPSSTESKSIDEWIDAVRSLINPGSIGRIHGRILILALARLDPSLAKFLASLRILKALEGELEESVAAVFKLTGTQSPPLDRDLALLHPDSPAAHDRLGREGFARALAARLRAIWNEYAQSGAPNSFILHLHGPWGSGKTSLLTMLKSALQPPVESAEGGSRWIVVDFNAWRHQRLEAPWWQLLDAVYRQAQRQLRGTKGQRRRALTLWITETLWRFLIQYRDLVFSVAAAFFLAGLVYWIFRPFGLIGQLDSASTTAKQLSDALALAATLISGGLVVGRSLVFGGVRSAQRFIESSADPMARISNHFEALVRRIDHPVAIIIDDLDRCQEEYVVRLLEGIQTLFNDPRLIYIIAADRRWLHACYETTYERFQDRVHEPGSTLGALFLEKVFQLSVALPRLSAKTRSAYWSYLIRGPGPEAENRLAEVTEAARLHFVGAASEAEVGARLESASDDPLLGPALQQAAVETLATADLEATTIYFLERFAHLLEPNPRAMKRLLNAYAVHRDLAILSGLNVLRDLRLREQLALWTIVSLRWPLLRDYLIDQIEGRVDDPGDAVRHLAGTPEVRQVLDGDKLEASLDRDSIRVLIGLGGREGEATGAVA